MGVRVGLFFWVAVGSVSLVCLLICLVAYLQWRKERERERAKDEERAREKGK